MVDEGIYINLVGLIIKLEIAFGVQKINVTRERAEFIESKTTSCEIKVSRQRWSPPHCTESGKLHSHNPRSEGQCFSGFGRFWEVVSSKYFQFLQYQYLVFAKLD